MLIYIKLRWQLKLGWLQHQVIIPSKSNGGQLLSKWYVLSLFIVASCRNRGIVKKCQKYEILHSPKFRWIFLKFIIYRYKKELPLYVILAQSLPICPFIAFGRRGNAQKFKFSLINVSCWFSFLLDRDSLVFIIDLQWTTWL